MRGDGSYPLCRSPHILTRPRRGGDCLYREGAVPKFSLKLIIYPIRWAPSHRLTPYIMRVKHLVSCQCSHTLPTRHIKPTPLEPQRSNALDAPQKRTTFRQFFRNCARHVNVECHVRASRGRSIRSCPERISTEDPGSHRQNASHWVGHVKYLTTTTYSHFRAEWEQI